MKSVVLFSFIVLLNFVLISGEPFYPIGFQPKKQSHNITFTENKGQVSDQNNKPRPDVLFGGTANGMVFHLRNNGISYQLNRVASLKEEDSWLNPHHSIMPGERNKVTDQISIYRIELNWLNCNKKFTVQHDDSLDGYANYYHEVCPNGVQKVRTYTGVTYKNIYNNIDLHYYEKDGNLKYDYIVAPNADYKKIQVQISGAKKITLQKDGSVLIITPFGEINEGKPLVFQNGKQVTARWVIKNNTLGFAIEDYNPAFELVIDPVSRIWGTYYGGNADESNIFCCTDGSGNVFLSGQSTSSSGTVIATTGSHQSSLSGNVDAFLVKFTTNGVRQWATYYGGASNENGMFCATDVTGNVFLSGTTSSTTGIASGGHQNSISGLSGSAFLVKFNSNGVRQWGTYYSGSQWSAALSCATDLSGNVYISGNTTSTSGIASAGHQNTFGGGAATYDAFLVKFNSSGVRQWGTYYGETGDERGFSCSTDALGNVYLAGHTQSTIGIASSGHQNSYAGSPYDAFLVKFNSNGVRQWGTYYGGSNSETGISCATDASGNVYLTGYTNSTGGISSGGHQNTYGGGTFDAYLVKFNSSGVRQWGTYYGPYNSSGGDFGWSCCTDFSGNVYLAGYTSSTINIASGGYQNSYAGGTYDSFLVKFNSNGIRQSATYYGGTGYDIAYSCATDLFGSVYVSGNTASNAGIASGGHQNAFAGGLFDAFLVKFNDCSIPAPPANSSIPSNLVLCATNSTTLNATGTGTVYWYSSPSGTTVLGTGTVFTTPALAAGNYTFYAEDRTCAPSASRTAITVTVHPTPNLTANSGAICVGQSITINPTGASTYTISGGNFSVSPASTTNYSITGTSTAGCLSNQVVCTVTVHPLPNVTAVSSPTSICSGESALLTASGANNYTWTSFGNTNTLMVTPNSTTTYSVIGTDNNGCSNTATISILVKPNPTVSVNNATICSGTQAVLNANVNPNAGIVYTWLPGGENSSSISVNPNATTVYSVSVNLDGCLSMATSTVNVVTAISPNAAFSYNGPYCTNQNAVSPILPLTFANGGQFNSTPEGLNINPNTGVIDPANSEPGIYQVTYTLAASGCSTSAGGTVNIQITVPAQLNLAPQVSMLSGEAYTLNVSGASSYSWSPPDFLSCTDCQNPIASPPYSMTYCVSSPNEVCIAKTCISINVETGCQGRELSLPNAFSPNGDGNNDEYCLRGWNECIAEFKIIIYNRWGEKVYESEQTEFCWDGIYMGKLLETEVYVYMLKAKLQDGTQISKNGNITLLR